MHKTKIIDIKFFSAYNLIPFLLIMVFFALQIRVSGYHHFYKNGSITKWRSFPVNFVVDTDSAAFQMQVATAFTKWNSITSAKDVLGSRTISAVDFTGENFEKTWGNLTGDGKQELVFDADGTAMAEAGLDPHDYNGYGPTREEADGTISDAYFIVNGSGLSGTFDRQSTIVHELGHIQGLAHSSVGMHNSGSFPSEVLKPIDIGSVPTMHPFPAGSTRQDPKADDIASLSELYPEPGFETSFSTIEGKITRCFLTPTQSVVGANVRIINKNVNAIQLTRFTSFDGNGEGRYRIRGVPPGTYNVVVEPMGANGFTIDRFGNPPSTFETNFATEYLSAAAVENNCPEEIPDEPDDLMASAGGALSDKDIKVQNIKLALVIDDTGSMSEEIAGARAGMSNAVTRFEQNSQQTGEPFPDVAIISFKDNVTTRLISNDPTRLQSVIAGITASGGADCPESSNAALQTAGRYLRQKGEAVLATDADSRPDGPSRATVDDQFRAKNLKLSSIVSGSCPNTLMSNTEENFGAPGANYNVFQSSKNMEEYRLPPTLGVESSIRTYSEFAAETGGLFVFLPGVNTSSAVEKQRYANIAANLFVAAAVPAIGLVSPGDGIRGRTFSVEIKGLTTNFLGSSQISFGDGITVNSRVVNSPEKITANITVAPDTAPGFRDVKVTTTLGTGVTEIATGVGAINITDPPSGAKLISVTPTDGMQGSTLNVDLFGSNTNFVNGTSIADFGSGITINSTIVTDPTHAVANITIQNTAVIGLRDVRVTTGSETATEDMPGPFLVAAPTAVIPRITTVTPSQGQRGQTLNVTVATENTNLVNGASAISFSGSGITVNSTTVASPTSATANITISPTADPTFRDVIITTNGETAAGLNAFQVIAPLNVPPVCSLARPSTTLISPPNRAFVPVNILGVTDPDNDPVAIAVTTVRQDEPVDHIGDGNFVPDSVINGSSVLLRAEAILGTVTVGGTAYAGNGRFYHVSFTATDTSNNSCSGVVKVAVPHTRTATPVDGGALFNSVTAQPARFSDFDGDKKSDVSVFRQGDWFINGASDGAMQTVHFGQPGDKIVPADFNGDGKTEIAVFRNGDWHLLDPHNGLTTIHFGQPGDKPVPADYDGDGKDDLAVFRQGVWHIMQSSTGYAAFHFGISTDKPVPADYDGDGKTDLAVFRDGTWYMLRSTQGFTALQFGWETDKVLPADYDGDGKADIGVYRNGDWYILNALQQFSAIHFGITTDLPTPADYDGDGKADFSVFREGIWYRLNSSNGQLNALQFGEASDEPIPAAFIP